MNGPPGRLYSIRDVRRQKLVYHHQRDANKPIQMTFDKGKVQHMINTRTGKVIYKSPSFKV
ncbi:uncharacterized protein GGS22DRAFT_154576 [Annulohypoxylon maeteangense]|uniref:uncharacterized protein n=1 Tax=Annulohypoxylon maeteangense TaxID=1927788 RepID=UPI0020086A31|nr:uncharacterized protein GGS22DRAFT_154576 [Annulohypoxylon maeteangense]KAI0887918.1 hypothetical protein GGS22DRAFT_154576 [Annulohypoxylon maeteangense]